MRGWMFGMFNPILPFLGRGRRMEECADENRTCSDNTTKWDLLKHCQPDGGKCKMDKNFGTASCTSTGASSVTSAVTSTVNSCEQGSFRCSDDKKATQYVYKQRSSVISLTDYVNRQCDTDTKTWALLMTCAAGDPCRDFGNNWVACGVDAIPTVSIASIHPTETPKKVDCLYRQNCNNN